MRAAVKQHQRGFAVVFGGNDIHAELFFVVIFFQQTLGSGAGRGDYSFAFQIAKAVDAGIFGGHQAGADFKESIGKIHLLLTLEIVGGGAAFQIYRAVAHQRDAVLRGNQVVAHFQIGHVELFFHRFHHFEL